MEEYNKERNLDPCTVCIEENILLREALKFYANDHGGRFGHIARDALGIENDIY